MASLQPMFSQWVESIIPIEKIDLKTLEGVLGDIRMTVIQKGTVSDRSIGDYPPPPQLRIDVLENNAWRVIYNGVFPWNRYVSDSLADTEPLKQKVLNYLHENAVF